MFACLVALSAFRRTPAPPLDFGRSIGSTAAMTPTLGLAAAARHATTRATGLGCGSGNRFHRDGMHWCGWLGLLIQQSVVGV